LCEASKALWEREDNLTAKNAEIDQILKQLHPGDQEKLEKF